MGYTREYYVGEEALQLRGVLKLMWPMELGAIEDWNAIEKILHYSFYTQLRIDPSEHVILCTYNPLWTRQAKEKLLEILFETFNIPGLFLVDYYQLLLMERRVPNAIIVDMQAGCTQLFAYQDYWFLSHLASTIPLGDRDVVNYTQRLLRQHGYEFTTSAEREIVRDIVCTKGYVAIDPDREEVVPRTYVLPDGTTITLTDELFRGPECFLDLSLVGKEEDPLHIVLNHVLTDLEENFQENPPDQWHGFWGGVVPEMRGFFDRINQEITHPRWNPNWNEVFREGEVAESATRLDFGEFDLFQVYLSEVLYDEYGPEIAHSIGNPAHSGEGAQ